ncbi:MAG: nascent polypeptide-associated complex protein [Candidatus Undinarchaeales archaeon]
MLPNLNPKQMNKMMKRLGMKMDQIDAEKVVISLKDGKKITVLDPEVVKMDMKGKESFQVSGTIKEGESESEAEADVELNEDDIKMVMSQADVSKEEAEEALKKADGDIAKAILELEE